MQAIRNSWILPFRRFEDVPMRIKHHFNCICRDELKAVLDQQAIPYEFFSMRPFRDEATLTFDVYEDEKSFNTIVRMIRDRDTHIQWFVFSETDLLAADWLTMRCKNASIDLSNEENIFRCTEPLGEGRYNHREIASTKFFVDKPVKWRNKHFAASYDLGTSHMFCDQYAYRLLCELKLPVIFENVYSFKSKEKWSDIFYLNIHSILPEEAIIINGLEKKVICPNCGKTTYMIDSCYQLNVAADALEKQHDICKTASIFGDHFSKPINLISQKMYRYLKNMHLQRNLSFEPVILS